MSTKTKPAPKAEPKAKAYRLVTSRKDKSSGKILAACISVPPPIAQVAPQECRWEFGEVSETGDLVYRQVAGPKSWVKKARP